ncbi:MAG: M28 family peptidase [Pseudomonadota bacterium]
MTKTQSASNMERRHTGRSYIGPWHTGPWYIGRWSGLSFLLLLSGLAACAVQDKLTTDVAAVDPANSIRDHVTWLAADERAGREAGTPGYDAAAEYLADQFRTLGVAPGNGDSYFQTVNLRTTVRDNAAAAFTLTHADGSTVSLTNRTDYLSGGNTAGTAYEVAGDLVFVGHGIVGGGYDHYADLDVNGKIVVAFNGAPTDMNSEVRAHLGSAATKARLAASRGARGLILMSASTRNPEENWQRAIARGDRTRWGWVGPNGQTSRGDFPPAFQMGPTGAALLFDGSAQSFDAVRNAANEQTVDTPLRGFDLQKRGQLRGGGVIEDMQSANVVGMIEGADPALRDEIVVLSAHLDHVGTHEPRRGGDDFIHNGALDNAMGVATLLDVARRFQVEGRPKRSVMLLAVTAEEKGLIGSDYFAHFPAVPLDRLVANVNLDMPLVLYPFTDVIAFGADRSTLGPMVRAAGEKAGVALIDDPYPNLSLFVRSDHYSFVKKGVPSVFLFLGTGNGGKAVFENFMATKYHSPSDDVMLDIQWEEAARFAALNYQIAAEIADAPAKPQWQAGDFFAAAAGVETAR